MNQPKAVFRGVILLYFVIGLEILIMISPAAAFFYAAFNPFLLSLAQSPATRWLTAFFLPHMVSPPDALLKIVRVAGSVLFVVGAVTFFVCAGQVYFNKFTKKGVALRGLYSWIRHPQYLGLAVTGLGLSILWPRFLVIALWAVMVALYTLLARDEERRMLGQFGEGYREYMDRTGLFLPKGVEGIFGKLLPLRNPSLRATVVLLVLAAGTVGGAFALRSYTVAALPLWSEGSTTALAILPNDLMMLNHRMASVLEMPEIKARLDNQPGPFLVYFMPKDYVMQGMIADTGGEWQLYKRHHTFAMIGDWIFHPFRHLENGHAAMHHDMGSGAAMPATGNGMVRRMIFLHAEVQSGQPNPAGFFGINTKRSPLFMADVDIHNLVLEDVRDLPAETGWGRVPTPIF
ncbi:MAG: isoprenylcysteine carboxylmethyltransferase family protein [Deltaproteobacteria bacterium]|nr:isoprenylcysteine carboxylmethyltransferase family protein [Deltaproteobacteria bacterium]